MITFQCKVLDSNDRWLHQTIIAASKTEAIFMLQKDGFLVAEIRQKASLWTVNSKIGSNKINRFFEMLSNQLHVGIPLLRSLEVIHENEASAKAKQIWIDLMQKISSGQSLSAALSSHPKYFANAEVSIVEAGEEGGFLPLALNRIVMLREWKSSISSRVWGAIAYPTILILVASIIVPFILIGIVPRFEPLYESLKQNGKMPWITQWLLQLSSFAECYGVAFFALIIGTTACWWFFTRKDVRSSTFEKILHRIPILGPVIHDWKFSQFCQTLSVLLENRVDLLHALSISAKSSNSSFLIDLIRRTKEDVISGKSIVPPLSQAKEINRDVIAMLHVGEQSNTLPVVLNKVASQLEQRLRKNLDVSIKLIEPILMMILAFVIGAIVIALVLPIFEGNGLGS